jgi:pyridoxal phosphate enzyme (YggS family)
MLISRTRACCSLAIFTWNRVLFGFSFQRPNYPSPIVTPFPRNYFSSTSHLRMSSEIEVDVGSHLDEVRQNIARVCKDSGRELDDVRLVAVSKTKPLALVQAAYASGQRCFGENYAQELVEKAEAIGHDDVQWHFIGGLQSNKANMLVKGVVPYGKLVVETVNSLKVAKKLDNAMNEFDGKTLEVFVQINTSGEDSKSGVNPKEAAELCEQIVKECERVKLKGVMTIGAPGDLECLDALVACRNQVAEKLEMEPKDLEVSMGMSGDYELAIQRGSTNVRVGSTIFGARDYSNKK